MATAHSGNKSVLLVVDVQVDVMTEAWDADRIIRNIGQLVSRAREQGTPVIWVQHETDDLPRGADAWQLVPELAIAPGEAQIDKRFGSSFEETTLADELTRLGATHIVLAGAETNWCIRATAYGALDRGYDLTLVKDAHTTHSIDLGDGSRIEAWSVVEELNIVMKRLRYPGRKNGTATAEEIDFSSFGGTAA
jgi:nicotinamidase-related amidase